MVLIEDVVQVILGSSYLADSSRWFYEFRENGSLTANSDCIGSFLKAKFPCHFSITLVHVNKVEPSCTLEGQARKFLISLHRNQLKPHTPIAQKVGPH